MPTQVEVNGNTLRLSPEFRYRVLEGDSLYVGEDQGIHGFTNERKLSPGDWIDSRDHVFVTAVGTARLEQFSHDEPDPVAGKSQAKPQELKGDTGSGPYDSRTVDELRATAKDKGLTGYSDLNKDELIAELKGDSEPKSKDEPAPVVKSEAPLAEKSKK